MSDSPGFGQAVTVVVPLDLVLAVRSSARMSRDGISDDYEGYRHKGREYEDLARRQTRQRERQSLLAPVTARKQLPASLNLYPRKNSHEASTVAP